MERTRWQMQRQSIPELLRSRWWNLGSSATSLIQSSANWSQPGMPVMSMPAQVRQQKGVLGQAAEVRGIHANPCNLQERARSGLPVKLKPPAVRHLMELVGNKPCNVGDCNSQRCMDWKWTWKSMDQYTHMSRYWPNHRWILQGCHQIPPTSLLFAGWWWDYSNHHGHVVESKSTTPQKCVAPKQCFSHGALTARDKNLGLAGWYPMDFWWFLIPPIRSTSERSLASSVGTETVKSET